MTDLHLFLAAWADTPDPVVILEKGLSLPDAEEVQRILAEASATERKKILETLAEVEKALALFAQEIALKSKEAKAEIDQSHKTQQACFKYADAGKLAGGEKDREET
ncbi:MAG: hypothetical protein GC136_01990 [Alphaproteobacteria bacterium]|nr:hypothetical protein [Alphaproteobacteria bacterium]